MARFLRKWKHEIGISPDQLLFRGKKKVDEILLRVINYNPTNLEEVTINSVEEVKKYLKTGFVTWFNVDGLHDTHIMEDISKKFNVDKMLLAEVMTTESRSRVIESDNALFISIKMLYPKGKTGFIFSENLSLILTETALISFQETKGDVFNPIRSRIKREGSKIRNLGTSYLLFSILDIVIDEYILLISILGEKIEALEDLLFNDPEETIVDKINSHKQELNFLRKNINPAKAMVLLLSKIDTKWIDKELYVHFKELKENINHACDATENYREILADQLTVYHTTMSSRLNKTMKFLTIFSVIFIPLTLIVGIYGTNFDNVPEFHYEFGYFIMLGGMFVIASAMLLYFKQKKWF